MATSAEEAVAERRVVRIWLAEFEFASGTKRVCSADVVYTGGDGRVWQPVGDFGTVNFVETTESGKSEALVLGLRASAVDNRLDFAAFVTAANDERRTDVFGDPMALYIQTFDPITFAEIGTPHPVIVGKTSHYRWARQGDVSAELQIICADDFSEGFKARNILYTSQDQRARFDGDKGCDLIAANTDRTVRWPRD